MEKHQDTKRKKTHPLGGDRVLSRWRVDGFYYQGQVMHHMDKQHVLVCFDMGILQNTAKRFLIPEADSSSSSSKVGKYVLLKTRPMCGMPIIRYVPAIVTFQKPKKKPSNVLTVVTFREKQLRVSANDIVTISENEYSFILKHLAGAQKENHEIMYGPEVYFANPRAISVEPEENNDREPSEAQDSGHSSPDIDSDVTSSRSLVLSVTLQDLVGSPVCGRTAETPEGYSSGRSKTSSEGISWTSPPETPTSPISHISSTNPEDFPGGPENEERVHSGTSDRYHNTPKDPDQTSTTVSNPSSPICSTTTTGKELKPEQDSILQQTLEEERKIYTLMQKLANQLEVMKVENRNTVRSIQPPKEDSLEQVLVRNPATGWYSPGRLIHNYSNEAFLVQSEDKTLKTLYPQDIIQDSEDKSTVVQKGDAVVCPYPMIDVQYCPAVVLQDLPMMWLQVRYYDGTEGYVAREETYVISDAEKEKITAEIICQEEAIIGRTVVARNDKDGIYYIGTVAPREWTGPRFVIEWTDRSQSIQLAAHMFAVLPEMLNLGVGSHVLALADCHPESFAYMPGIVMKTNNKQWHVQFINGQSALLLHRNQMYRISEKYYKLSEMYFEKVH